MNTSRTHFQNGYGMSLASVDGTLEIAVLYDGEICYDSPITEDVVRGVTLKDIIQIAETLKALPRKNAAADAVRHFIGSDSRLEDFIQE